MNIRFYPDKEEYRDLELLVRKFILFGCHAFKIDTEKVTEVNIADDDHYHEAICASFKEERCTKNAYFTGVGKCISRVVNNNIEHHLIYNIKVFEGLISYLENENTEKEYVEQLSMETFLHEFGHLVDNEARKQFSPGKPFDTKKFSIDIISQYYIDIIISEFFACYHSAFIVSKKIFINQNSCDNSGFKDMYKNLGNLKEMYSRKEVPLVNIAFDASLFFWNLLMQYSKLIAAKFGNKNLNTMDIKLFDGCPHGVADLVIELEENLDSLINSYPTIPDEVVNNIIEIWYNIAQLFGYLFVEEAEGDALYLQTI